VLPFGCAASYAGIVLACPSGDWLRLMPVPMLPYTHHDKVFWPIVVLVAIQMVNMFVGLKFAAKSALHHNPMLVLLSIGRPYPYILASLRVAPSLPSRSVRTSAISPRDGRHLYMVTPPHPIRGLADA
jgi:hypothetical protein